MPEQIISGSGTQYELIVNSDGSINMIASGLFHDLTTQLIQRIDYQDKMQPVYMGLAIPGTAVTTAGWQIRKNTFSGANPEMITAVLFGSGNANFDKVWNSRSGTAEVYS